MDIFSSKFSQKLLDFIGARCVFLVDLGHISVEKKYQAMETVHIKTGASTGVNWKNV